MSPQAEGNGLFIEGCGEKHARDEFGREVLGKIDLLGQDAGTFDPQRKALAFRNNVHESGSKLGQKPPDAGNVLELKQ